MVAQFAVSVFFIACSLIMRQQMQWVNEKDLGFNEEQLLVIDTATLPEMLHLHGPFKERLLQHAHVLAATALRYKLMEEMFGKGISGRSVRDEQGRAVETRQYWVDYDFVSALQLNLLAGHDFAEGRDALESGSMIVNESFVKAMGWEDAVGQNMQFDEGDRRLLRSSEGRVRVVGVVKDFHFGSLYEQSKPVVLLLNPSMGWESKELVLRIAPEHISETIEYIRKEWQAIAPEDEFIYSFVDQDLERYYRSEVIWAEIVRYGALFSVGIACLGALGLALLASSRRTKEIGLRKAMGASVMQMALLLSRDFASMVFFATLLALPAIYYAMSLWLRDFAYRIGSIAEFALLGGLIVLVAVVVPVGAQALRAARSNPVEALRCE